MKRLGIVVAMTAEARSLVNQPIGAGRQIALSEGAVLQVSGIGSTRASLAARALLEGGAFALLSWGIAGGLHPELLPGSVILPRAVISTNHSIHPSDPAWHDRLYHRLKSEVDLCTGALAESAIILRTPQEKAHLYRQTGAYAVDMESGAVARMARTAGVPFLAIRAVADSAGTEVPRAALHAFDQFGQLSLKGLLKGLTYHPLELFSLLRFSSHFGKAQTTLRKVAKRIGGSWAVP